MVFYYYFNHQIYIKDSYSTTCNPNNLENPISWSGDTLQPFKVSKDTFSFSNVDVLISIPLRLVSIKSTSLIPH